ncbi:copper resistance protein B [uncultured Brevundimonas sp.]|uniref:copper resistance protein B n=1 Tax=uncultured Brevundimonas sp. TaxID=213418 RepID=UPI002634FA23|nr:copper resistance protein B [uncultured Brevundimonas sp.]
MIRTSVALLPLMLVAAPAFAQSHAGHTPTAQVQPAPLPPGCVRRAAPNADPSRIGSAGAPVCPAGAVPARLPTSASDPHAGHDMSTMGQTPAAPAMPMGHDMSTMGQAPAAPAMRMGHDMSTMGQMPTGHDMQGMAMPPDVPTSANNPGRPPETPPPARASSGPAHAADLLFDPAEMEASREELRIENGDILTTAVIVERLEGTFADDGEGYAWDAQGWSGGDINRFWWKSEGEGAFGGKLEKAEVQALYSRAVLPFWNLQAGLRQTYRPEADRTDLVVAMQGLAPYWFEVDASAFLSNRGELTARVQSLYDQRITQRWILQPRAEVLLSAEDIPELSIGSGLSSLQLSARLRYEVRKEFAPYVGVEWTRSFGNTADFLEADGRSAEDTRFVVGVRAWF